MFMSLFSGKCIFIYFCYFFMSVIYCMLNYVVFDIVCVNRRSQYDVNESALQVVSSTPSVME